MSTSGGYHEYIRGYHGYIGDVQYIEREGIMMHVGDIMTTLGVFSASGDTMSTLGGYHEYIEEYSVHQGDIMSTSGDVQYIGGYHDACGGIS